MKSSNKLQDKSLFYFVETVLIAKDFKEVRKEFSISKGDLLCVLSKLDIYIPDELVTLDIVQGKLKNRLKKILQPEISIKDIKNLFTKNCTHAQFVTNLINLKNPVIQNKLTTPLKNYYEKNNLTLENIFNEIFSEFTTYKIHPKATKIARKLHVETIELRNFLKLYKLSIYPYSALTFEHIVDIVIKQNNNHMVVKSMITKPNEFFLNSCSFSFTKLSIGKLGEALNNSHNFHAAAEYLDLSLTTLRKILLKLQLGFNGNTNYQQLVNFFNDYVAVYIKYEGEGILNRMVSDFYLPDLSMQRIIKEVVAVRTSVNTRRILKALNATKEEIYKVLNQYYFRVFPEAPITLEALYNCAIDKLPRNPSLIQITDFMKSELCFCNNKRSIENLSNIQSLPNKNLRIETNKADDEAFESLFNCFLQHDEETFSQIIEEHFIEEDCRKNQANYGFFNCRKIDTEGHNMASNLEI